MSTNGELEKRVRNLETTRTIVIAVAIVFGISGGWGAYVLNQINSALDKAESRVKELGDAVDAANKAASALTAQNALENQVREVQNNTAGTLASTRSNTEVGGKKNGLIPTIQAPTQNERPFLAAVKTFRNKQPSEPYVMEGYESDLRGLSDLLLGYLGYLQSGNRVDSATSDQFFGEVLLAATDVKTRSSQRLTKNDQYYEWHTKTSLDNFMSIVGRMKNEQQSASDNSLPPSRITFYEIDIPHWRDGVLGIPLG